jgi:hypothetical protein
MRRRLPDTRSHSSVPLDQLRHQATDDDIVAQAGESVTTDSKVTMTASPLKKGDTTLSKGILCSTVTYANGGRRVVPEASSLRFPWNAPDRNEQSSAIEASLGVGGVQGRRRRW